MFFIVVTDIRGQMYEKNIRKVTKSGIFEDGQYFYPFLVSPSTTALIS
jgi:hypothetical protein